MRRYIRCYCCGSSIATRVCMVLEAVNASHRTACRGSCCSCPVSSVPLGGGGSIVHAASAAKFAFGVEEVYRRSVGCETPDAFAEVVVGANGVKHSVCRFGGIGGVSLIEVSSALVELNCRCRCSPIGVEVSS
eukprot:g78889.t1